MTSPSDDEREYRSRILEDRRPWGKFRSFPHQTAGAIKIITVAPGGTLSLQYHRRRAEFWIALDAGLEVTVGERTWRPAPDEEIYIPREARHRLRSVGTFPNDPSLSDPIGSQLELRLDHGQDLAVRGRTGDDCRQDLAQGDEGDVDRDHVGTKREVRRLDRPGVRPLDHGYPRVVPQGLVDLAVGDVEGDHLRRTSLEQAVGEATGRCPDVQAPGATDL